MAPEGGSGEYVYALVKPLFLRRIQLILQPIPAAQSHNFKSSTAGCFITLEKPQANPYVAGEEPWPKAEDPTGTVPAPAHGCTFLLLLLTKAKSTLKARHREGKVHTRTPSTVFCKQQMTGTGRLSCIGQRLGSRICNHLQACLAFVSVSSADGWKQAPSSSALA